MHLKSGMANLISLISINSTKYLMHDEDAPTISKHITNF